MPAKSRERVRPLLWTPSSATFAAGVLALGASLLLLGIGVGLNRTNTHRLYDDQRWVIHTHEVLAELEALLSTVKDAETGQRGFLLTGDQRDLAPYQQALGEIRGRLAHLRQLTADNARQRAHLAELEPLVADRLTVLARGLELALQGDRAGALEMVRSGLGRSRMEALRRTVAAMEREERELLARRSTESRRSLETALSSILLIAVVGAAMVALAAFLLHRNRRQEHRAAEALDEERERLRVTLASIGDAVIVTDAAGRVTFLNGVAVDLTGWNDDALGRPLAEVFAIVNEQSGEIVESPVDKVLRLGNVVGLANHTVLIARDGRRISIDDSGAPVRNAEGEIAGVVLVFRDIDERRAAERERDELQRSTADANLRLRQAEEQFRTLADSIPQLAWMTDGKGKVLWFNRRWYDYTGIQPEDIDRRDRSWLLDPDERARIQAKFAAHIASGEPWEDTFPLRRHDGVFRWHLSRAVPVRDEGGHVVHWFGTNTDVTDRLVLEEGLRKLAADLSEADRRKDEFLATLSHELRNPLAPLWTGLQVLKLVGNDRPDARQAREIMERQLQQMVRLVDDLLDVSRITRNKLELRRERAELAAILGSSIETSRAAIDAGELTLTVALPPAPVILDADVTRLAQVFSNLLNNAAKYTEKGGNIWLTATVDGDQVAVSVKDSGIGIPAEMLPRVFDMFTQIDRTLDRSQGGLGIGLTLVKRLVELHGGSVEARSEGHGRGSELIVRLPIAATASAGEAAADVVVEAARTARLPPSRILVVDDKGDAVDTLRLVLEHAGHQVAMAGDGLAAVAEAETFRPDIILLDIGMPKLNGYEACRRIRKLPGHERTLIVALTGWGQEEDRRRSREAGFNHHLVKPIAPDELVAILAGLYLGR